MSASGQTLDTGTGGSSKAAKLIGAIVLAILLLGFCAVVASQMPKGGGGGSNQPQPTIPVSGDDKPICGGKIIFTTKAVAWLVENGKTALVLNQGEISHFIKTVGTRVLFGIVTNSAENYAFLWGEMDKTQFLNQLAPNGNASAGLDNAFKVFRDSNSLQSEPKPVARMLNENGIRPTQESCQTMPQIP